MVFAERTELFDGMAIVSSYPRFCLASFARAHPKVRCGEPRNAVTTDLLKVGYCLSDSGSSGPPTVGPIGPCAAELVDGAWCVD